MAAHVVRTYTKECSCCDLTAEVTEWSCGCVKLDYDRSAAVCGDCDNFRDLEESCGKDGEPGG
jgi:hypothetical protein